MTAKHTPGPWRLGAIVGSGDGAQQIRSEAHWIGTVAGESPRTGKSLEEAMANARLIIAGPDLLPACERLVGAIEALAIADRGGPSVSWDAIDASQDLARAAIAKARGEA